MLYLTRRIETVGSALWAVCAEVRGTAIDAGALALEIQRSLDYYESHYDQTPVGELVIAPGCARAQRLAGGLQQRNQPARQHMDVRNLFSVATKRRTGHRLAALMALGAALRDDKVEP